MKTNLLVIFIAAIFVLSFSVKSQAQDAKIGLKGGASLYSGTGAINIDLDIPELDLVESYSEEESSGSKIGLAVGLFVEKPFSDILSGQIEALYVQKGGKENIEDAGLDEIDPEIEVSEGNITLSYIDIPVLLKINIPLDGDIQPFIYGGGFAGYLLDVSLEADGQSVDEVDIKDVLTDLNYGVLFGGGINFGSISLDIRYDLGLANIFDKNSSLFSDLTDELDVTPTEKELVNQILDDVLDGIELTTSGLQFTVGVSF